MSINGSLLWPRWPCGSEQNPWSPSVVAQVSFHLLWVEGPFGTLLFQASCPSPVLPPSSAGPLVPERCAQAALVQGHGWRGFWAAPFDWGC